ncbi:hypothetical protein TSUD_109000 [Trifolium subterraneum]|nr:hypothetical protein TSUD_109000 [Trifolium subterraneum]
MHIPAPKQFCSLNISASTLHLYVPCSGGVHLPHPAAATVSAPVLTTVPVPFPPFDSSKVALVCCCRELWTACQLCITSLAIWKDTAGCASIFSHIF